MRHLHAARVLGVAIFVPEIAQIDKVASIEYRSRA